MKTIDPNEVICERYHIIRKTLSDLDIEERDKDIFRWRFFHGNSLNKWKGPEKLSEIYGIFNKVKLMIVDKINPKP